MNSDYFVFEGGKMGDVCRSKDWRRSSLGTLDTWSAPLRFAVIQCLNSQFPIAIYWGADLNTLYNDGFADLMGDHNDMAFALPCKEAWPEVWKKLKSNFDEVFRTGKIIRNKNTVFSINRHGSLVECHFDYTLAPIHDSEGKVVGILNEITETSGSILEDTRLHVPDQKEIIELRRERDSLKEILIASNQQQRVVNESLNDLNKELKVSQDELSLAIDAANLATWDLNTVTGRFKGNDLLKTWFGLPIDQDIEPSLATEMVAEYDRERVVQTIQRAMDHTSGGRYDLDYTIINEINPEPRIVRAKGKMFFDDNNQPIRFSGVLQDVTEIKQDEQRKNDFIAMVSHELKTPLTSINACLQILHRMAKKNQDSLSENLLQKSVKQIGRMTSLIHGFLNVSRLESGKIQINLERFDLSKLMRDVTEEFMSSISTHHLKLTPCETIWVYADQDKIGQVINNLISNAIKYSPQGTTIQIACNTIDLKVIFSVNDEGVGISDADLPKLFERYYRVNTLQSSNISGFGIGLYLCCEIIKSHQGKLWVESELGKGSTFYFSLAEVK
jgi:two-component system sensor histidine kinase VicK